MIPVQLMVIPVWVERLGWTLVHSLWQLTVIAIVAAIVLRLLRNRSARVRYAAAITTLGLMVSGPVATWLLVSVEPVRTESMLLAAEEFGAGHNVPSVVQKPVTTEAGSVGFEETQPVVALAVPLAADAEEKSALARPSEVDVDSARETSAPATLPGSKPRTTASIVRESIEKCARMIKPHLPILVSVWISGVLICSVRPVWGLWIQWRLRRAGLQPVSESIQSTLNALIKKLRLTRAVRIAESALVKVPMVVGYLHPMILLPASVITGLTSSQLEAVLAHELAHVRRHDWLVNALQVIVETLLFYHPAVWWLSSRIRQERELCCDDIALSLNVDKAVFARTLLMLEELRQQTMTPALAATGGDLAARVRRLLPRTGSIDTSNHRASLTGLLSMATALIMLTILVSQIQTATSASMYDGTIQVADQKTQDQESAEPEITGSSVAPSTAQNIVQDDETDSATTNEVRKRTVKVMDENEQPIAGAEVRLQFENRSESRAQLAEPLSTDANGEVTVDAPLNFDQVHLSVKAEGFGEFRELQQATGLSIVRLKRGRVIHVRAVDEAGKILRKAVPLLNESRIFGREFVLQEDGTFRSPSVALNRRLMRVVTAQENGPFLFSDLIDVAEAEAGPDDVLEVVLKPGSRITGRLDESVPRPISEGYVQLMVVEGPDHELRIPTRDQPDDARDDSWRNRWTWQDSAAVQPDGTFLFESVPSGGLAQIHVVIDGYMSVNPPIAELAATIDAHNAGQETILEGLTEQVASRAMWPHLVLVTAEQVQLTVKCRPTASCDFRILDPSGNPVPDASVSFSPNGIFAGGKLFIPGAETFQNASLVHQLFWDIQPFAGLNGQAAKTPRDEMLTKERQWAERSFLRAKSDKDGRVQIRNLPGGVRDGFRVTANGLVLPRSPLFPSLDDRRESYVDLVAGETVEATIYLERDQPVVEREILVINKEGSPLPNVSVALAEMRVGEKDWQQWSTQRFGAPQTANTDSDGRVTLQIPSVIDAQDVERVRLAVNLKTNDLWVSGELVDVPLKSDNGLIAIVPDLKSERRGRAKYGSLNEILNGANSGQLLQSMIKKPSLAILRQLLSAAKSEFPEPVELLGEEQFAKGLNGARVHLIPNGETVFAMVKARVRPADGSRRDEKDMSDLPECVFVFDSDGKPVAALGGEIGTTGAGSPDRIDILSFGPEEDWFVRATRFQDNGPFEYQSVYYRIGESVVASLKYYHYANSNSWSNGPEKTIRHGKLSFDFPDSPDEHAGQTVGMTAEGVAIIGRIYWDGDNNKFWGAPAQSVDGRPLYKVDAEWSKEFSALNPKADQMVLSGGVREFDHWHGWGTVVPEGYDAIVRLSIPSAAGEPKVLEQKLKAGLRTIQLQLKPTDAGTAVKLESGYGEDKQMQNADLPFRILDQQNAPAIVNVVDAQKSVRLVKRPLDGSAKLLTLDVQLLPQSEIVK